MNEKQPIFEIKKEHIPTSEEVLSVISKLTKKERIPDKGRELEDEDGLYLLEIIVPGNLPGEENEYAYMKKGVHPQGRTSQTCIYVTYCQDGIPISGDEVARLIDGKWELIPI